MGIFFFSSRRRHTRFKCDWSSDVCSSDLDLVGSTALSARLDPEDMREIIGAYHRCCAEAITKAGCFVAKHMCDGGLDYFGYPPADPQDAGHAVRVGRSRVDPGPKLKTSAAGPLQRDVAIATGRVA